MGHRAKHRHAALVRRVAQGRTIKPDLTPEGQAAYHAARPEADALIAATEQKASKSVFAQAADLAEKMLGQKADADK